MELLGFNIPSWAFLVVALFTLLYIYFTWNYNIWHDQGITCIKRYPLFGSLTGVFNKPFHDDDMLRYKKYGKLYGMYEGSTPVLVISDPELLKSVFVKDFGSFPHGRIIHTGSEINDNMVFALEGEDWKRVRTIMTPAFTTGKLRRICSLLKDCGNIIANNLTTASKSGNPVNIKSFTDAYAFDVIGSCLYGLKIDSYNDTENQFLTMGRKVFQRSFDLRFAIAFIWPNLMKWFKISFFPSDVMTYFTRLSKHIIKERQEEGKKRNDLLQILLDASKETFVPEELEDDKDEDFELGTENNQKELTQPKFTSKTLSQVEFASNSVMFLVGGFEGASVTLSFALYHAALNPDCQERLIEEIDKVCSRKDEVDYDCIREMTYLDCFIKESLRMYPTAFRTEREASESYTVGDTGITVPKGGVVIIPIYAMHHDPEYFPDPEKFDPDRFSSENKSSIIPYTYLPFGAGPRNCLGMRFAMLEIKMCLVQLFRKFRFARCPETKVPPQFRLLNFFMSPVDVTVKIIPRTDI